MSLEQRAEKLGKDLGVEIQSAVDELGAFQAGAVNQARDSTSSLRSKNATWANVAERVALSIGSGFRISSGSVRHYCYAKRARSLVARNHKPRAAVAHKKLQEGASAWNVDAQFTSKLVKTAIATAIARGGTVLSSDGYAVWGLTGSGFTKMPSVLRSTMVKIAPYSDATPLTGLFKCVTNSLLFYWPADCSDAARKKNMGLRSESRPLHLPGSSLSAAPPLFSRSMISNWS